MSISIIIPVRNEEDAIGPCLDSLADYSGLEILVVDGDSSDQTIREIQRRGCRPVASAPGRGKQQHTGAKVATGDFFLFLHCDTRLPSNFSTQVRRILEQEGIAAGAFQLAINAHGMSYRIIEYSANLRSRLLQLPYGDQALFMKKDTYFAANGFPDQPILEELALISRLKKLGRIIIAPAYATTSARRWQQHGIMKTTIVNQLMLVGWAMGISSERLARWYYNEQK